MAAAAAGAGAEVPMQYIPKTTIKEINQQILQLNDYTTLNDPNESSRLEQQQQIESLQWVNEQEKLKVLMAIRNTPVSSNSVPQASQEINDHGEPIVGGLAYEIQQLSEVNKLRFEGLIPAMRNRAYFARGLPAKPRGGRRRRQTKKRRGRKLTRRHR
jgi:hypothetical protein